MAVHLCNQCVAWGEPSWTLTVQTDIESTQVQPCRLRHDIEPHWRHTGFPSGRPDEKLIELYGSRLYGMVMLE